MQIQKMHWSNSLLQLSVLLFLVSSSQSAIEDIVDSLELEEYTDTQNDDESVQTKSLLRNSRPYVNQMTFQPMNPGMLPGPPPPASRLTNLRNPALLRPNARPQGQPSLRQPSLRQPSSGQPSLEQPSRGQPVNAASAALHHSFVKPGTCPMRACNPATMNRPVRVCWGDQHCGGENKCCADPCQRRMICTRPGSHVHPGTCPRQEFCDMSYKLVCEGDQHCPLRTKCCYDSCYRLKVCKRSVLEPTTTTEQPSVTPDPEVPTPTTTAPTSVTPVGCKFMCPGSEQCCDGVVKPGFCPSPALCYPTDILPVVRSTLSNCVNDYQCRWTEKCCYDQCHQHFFCRPIVNSPIDHPGQCPLSPPSCNNPSISSMSQCSDDRNCKIHERCCVTPCRMFKVCMPALNGLPGPPITTPAPPSCNYPCPGTNMCCDNIEKSGFCPAPGVCPFPQSITVQSCQHDYDCADNMKCCHDSCLLKKICKTVVLSPYVHPGTCYATPITCPTPSPFPNGHHGTSSLAVCSTDSDCQYDKKCCYDVCNNMMTCIPAQPLVVPPTAGPTQPTPNTCAHFCPGSKVCCDGGEKAGHCPARSTCFSSSSFAYEQRCSEDYDCSLSEKCCFDDCLNRAVCRPAVQFPSDHPGSCPAMPSGCAVPAAASTKQSTGLVTCLSDSNCAYEERCCLDPCSNQKICQPAVRDQTTTPMTTTAPPTIPTTTTPATAECKYFCPGSRVCCDGGEKEGYCPAPSNCIGTLPVQPPRCLEDYACPNQEKCCYDNCRKQKHCIPATSNPSEHPGQCPVPQTDCFGERRYKSPCIVDKQCQLQEKCCHDTCQGHKVCVAIDSGSPPTMAPPGPTTTLAPPPNCQYPCPSSPTTCCDGVSKADFCPADSVCGGLLLNPLPTCSQDYACPGTEKCCYDRCSRTRVCRPSVDSVHSHPGTCPANTEYVCQSSYNINKRQCSRDAGCRFNQKCCYVPCEGKHLCLYTDDGDDGGDDGGSGGGSATTPLPGCSVMCPGTGRCCDGATKPDFCPAYFKCMGSMDKTLQECSEDYECKGSDKCCQDVCSNRKVCLPSVPHISQHPGVCPGRRPFSRRISSRLITTCSTDAECLLDQKCCIDSSDHSLSCEPSEFANFAVAPNVQCTYLCPDSRIRCCDHVEKEDVCPRVVNCNEATSVTARSCSGPDYDCPAAQKCCYDDCKNENYCRQPVQDALDHAGVCPDPSICTAGSGSSENELCTNTCVRDISCNWHEKCCPDTRDGSMKCMRVRDEPYAARGSVKK